MKREHNLENLSIYIYIICGKISRMVFYKAASDGLDNDVTIKKTQVLSMKQILDPIHNELKGRKSNVVGKR